MGELDTLLYACCPKCSKPIGRSKRCDGMELNCPKCGSPLRVVVDQDAKVMVRSVAAGIAAAIHSAGCSYAVSADPSYAGRYEQWAVESGRHHGAAAIG